MAKKFLSFLRDYSNPNSLGSRLRRKRAKRFIALIEYVSAFKNQISIIDIGGTRTYWTIFDQNYLRQKGVHITIVNLPGTYTGENDDLFTYIEGDGCDLSFFPDRAFDIVHSNSVIEHVGSWKNMMKFSRETERLATYAYYVQTPNYWFFYEPHSLFPFFHWLPLPFQIWLLKHFSLGWGAQRKNHGEAIQYLESSFLLSKTMLQELFPLAEIHYEKFLCLNKSLIAIKQIPPSLASTK